jgi:1-deoxy-D-xylulose-5-phosphate synthase
VARPKAKTYSDIFTQALIDVAALEPNLVAITPATAEGSGLVKFGKAYPDRFFDVAICEQHAVTMAGGMAKAGLKPVVSIYSTFLQRAMDQVVHDVAIMNLPVCLVLIAAAWLKMAKLTKVFLISLGCALCLTSASGHPKMP